MKKKKSYFLCNNICFPRKREFHLFYYNAIFKDRVSFKLTQSSIEIDVIVVKKYVFFNFVENYVRLQWRKRKVMLLLLLLLNMPDYAYINRILNTPGVLKLPQLWICESCEYGRVLIMQALHSLQNIPEYSLIELWF